MLVVILIILIGCSDNSKIQINSISYFPVQKETQDAYPQALLQGTLVLEDGCLRVIPADGGESNLIIWPYGYSFDINGNKIQILNDKNQPVAIVGDYVFVGGGLQSQENLEKVYLSQSIPDRVKGPYRLAAPSDQDRPYELAPIFYTQSGAKVDYPPGIVEGILILDQGYILLDIDNGKTISPIWPAGYSCRITDYMLHVVDKNGQSRASVGDKITLNGAELPPEMWGKYTGVSGPSNDFTGPYWLVSEVIPETR